MGNWDRNNRRWHLDQWDFIEQIRNQTISGLRSLGFLYLLVFASCRLTGRFRQGWKLRQGSSFILYFCELKLQLGWKMIEISEYRQGELKPTMLLTLMKAYPRRDTVIIHRLKDGFPTSQKVSGKVVDQHLSHFNSNEACIVSLLRASDEKLNFITNWEPSYSIPWTPFGGKIQSISDMEELSGEM